MSLVVAGCIFSSGQSELPEATPTPGPASTASPSPVPTATPIPTPAANATPTPTAVPPTACASLSNAPDATPTPVPVRSAQASDWGSDKDTYARGDTATGWTCITNTGNVPIDEIGFTIVIKKSVFGFPVERSYSYAAKGLGIPPGEIRKVEFSQPIPAEYDGLSTAGDFQLTVTAWLDNGAIGTYSKNVKVV